MTTRTKIITVYYANGHSCTQYWDHEEMWCPSCNNSPLWSCAAHGDYYQGMPFLCLDCGRVHYIDSAHADEKGYGQSLEKLRQDTVP